MWLASVIVLLVTISWSSFDEERKGQNFEEMKFQWSTISFLINFVDR